MYRSNYLKHGALLLIIEGRDREGLGQSWHFFLKGLLTHEDWLHIFLLQCLAGGSLVVIWHIVSCSMQQIINYRLLIIDQFRFESFKNDKPLDATIATSRGQLSTSVHTEQ